MRWTRSSLLQLLLVPSVVCAPSSSVCNLGKASSSCGSCIEHSECSWCPENGLCINNTAVSLSAHPPSYTYSCSSSLMRICEKASPNHDQANVFEHFSVSPRSKNSMQRTSITYQELMENYVDQQWAYDLINLPEVWAQGIFGQGIRVRVNDDGVDRNNPHWRDRFDLGASCDNEEKLLASSSMQHGTTVASIIGASNRNEDTCTVGVAPAVTLSACYALKLSETFLGTKIDQIDISSNSFEQPACRSYSELSQRHRVTKDTPCPFAYSDFRSHYDPCLVCDDLSTGMGYNYNDAKSPECIKAIVEHCIYYYEIEKAACSEFFDLIIDGECNYIGLSSTARENIVKGITEGRGGKGVIYVFASGNSYVKGDDTNLKGYTSSRLTISVGAVGGDRRHAHYSTGGAGLFISAPVGDVNDSYRHFSARAGEGCTSAGVGTSFATPVVSGVIALMLEVNPNLGWRDVQGILVESAIPVLDDPLDDAATYNGAGVFHSTQTGFGIIDAAAAVELSRTWINYSDEKLIAVDSGILDLPIYDDASSETVSVITIPFTEDMNKVQRQASNNQFTVEAVEVLLSIAHFSRGDVSVTLVSPSGTESILHPGSLPENSQLHPDQSWKLMSVKYWGESPYGEWRLIIVDEKAGEFRGCANVPEFQLVFPDTAVLSCETVERAKICLDGDFNVDFFEQGNYDALKSYTDEDGRTMKEACCDCGGGLSRQEFKDLLRQWTIAIYGREPNTESKFASFFPSQSPSVGPTSFPSQQPINSPTFLPTLSPTFDPTAFPTESPTISPTSPPTATPTLTPTTPPTPTPTNAPSPLPASSSPSMQPSHFSSQNPSETTSQMPSPFPSLMPSSSSNANGSPAGDSDNVPTHTGNSGLMPIQQHTPNPNDRPSSTGSSHPSPMPSSDFFSDSNYSYSESLSTFLPSLQPSTTPSSVSNSSDIHAASPTGGFSSGTTERPANLAQTNGAEEPHGSSPIEQTQKIASLAPTPPNVNQQGSQSLSDPSSSVRAKSAATALNVILHAWIMLMVTVS